MYLVFIDHIERLHFFNRVQFYSEKIVFVTARLSVYLLAKYKYKHKFVYYIKNKHSIHGVFDEQINNSRDYKAGYVSYNDANILAGSVLSALKELTSSEDVKGILMWNGTDVAERVIGNFSRENNIELYYFEISNLPGKLFIDSMGTNADSVLFHSKDLNWMSQIPKKNNLEYVDFLDVYKKIKSGEYILPQSKKIKSLNYYFLIDYVGSFFSITPRTQSLSIFKKNILNKKKVHIECSKKNSR
ncbi:hypothetical protein [Pectobacterium parvum]|uniref:Uncharacterized protein n=1 Tax=Pectobacterium parvum TaxID=2778550 RepID=A0AAP9LDD3_9GAMM|nr:hypothetical protein [Pectobacterium parvum]QHQ25096.1 hypothetical protein GMX10_14225 [Pectobacterium parvum]